MHCEYCGHEHHYKISYVDAQMFVRWFCSLRCRQFWLKGDVDPRRLERVNGGGDETPSKA